MSQRSISPALQRLIAEDAVNQLRQRRGRMAELGSENAALKLDWVEGVARLLEQEHGLEEVERQARELWEKGIRHIIWAGMGGSIITVRVMQQMGFCDSRGGQQIAIYPLDSTDPAALNRIIQQIADTKGVELAQRMQGEQLQTFLQDVMMIGVAMGMTSEEPITHLTWFVELLEEAQLSPAEHILVMSLPDSYLDRFARKRHAPVLALQLDGGNGTGGRMSAPSTRVFLLPAALYITRLTNKPGELRRVLQLAWQHYNLEQAELEPAEHPFVRLAAALSERSVDGACRLLLTLPRQWKALFGWIEQLMEESLGKGGKGVVVFREQELNVQAPVFSETDLLRVQVVADHAQQQEYDLLLQQPYLLDEEPQARLAGLAASFMGWQLSMALYGYLQEIVFAGQPAVENYKARARALRELPDPLQAIKDWQATTRDEGALLLAPTLVEPEDKPTTVLARAIRQAVFFQQPRLGYLDLTYNGTAPEALQQQLNKAWSEIGNQVLGVPVKMRQGPADYHSTEQSEMDGPAYLVSLRLLIREHEPIKIGSYNDLFLQAQAISTWQAMVEQGRACFLLILDGSPTQAGQYIERFLKEVQTALLH